MHAFMDEYGYDDMAMGMSPDVATLCTGAAQCFLQSTLSYVLPIAPPGFWQEKGKQ